MGRRKLIEFYLLINSFINANPTFGYVFRFAKKNIMFRYFQLSIAVALGSLLLFSCESQPVHKFPEVNATVQTVAVNTQGDAADDPAVWYNAGNPAESRIIGTDKKAGLAIYNLSGQLINFAQVGKINNCDVAYGLTNSNDSTTIDLVGGSNRSNNSVSLYKYLPTESTIDTVALIHIPSQSIEIYGFCFYTTPNRELFSFSVGKDGLIEQNKITFDSTGISARRVWSYTLPGQCEGLVVDNENGILFVSEEDFGIYKFDLKQSSPVRTEIASINSLEYLAADIEGLTLYYGSNGKGYLIASSQGNNSYALFDRQAPHAYLGSFRIVAGANIDGTSETDGIDVTNLAKGESFPHGFFIALEGENLVKGAQIAQNFKLVPWEEISLTIQPDSLKQ